MNNRQRIFLVAAFFLSATGLPFYFLQYYSAPILSDSPQNLSDDVAWERYFSGALTLPPRSSHLIIKLGTADSADGIYARPRTSPNRAAFFGIAIPGLLLTCAIVLLLGWRSTPPRLFTAPIEKAKPVLKAKKITENSRALMIAALVVFPLLFAVDPGSVMLLLRNRFPRWLTWWFAFCWLGTAGHNHPPPG